MMMDDSLMISVAMKLSIIGAPGHFGAEVCQSKVQTGDRTKDSVQGSQVGSLNPLHSSLNDGNCMSLCGRLYSKIKQDVCNIVHILFDCAVTLK